MQPHNDTATKQPYSALTADQWGILHGRVFDGAGESLNHLEGWARGNYLPPVATVLMAALWALSSLPAGTTYNAGAGPGSPNTFIALVGRPGQGKDRLASHIATNVKVSQGNRPINIQEAPLGSGEGVAARCAPHEDTGVAADPVIFGESEVGRVETLMNRQGSTLRFNINQIYSGNALGSTNRDQTPPVPRNSYTAGIWVGVQPDKAGALLAGPDDGLAHRFIWTELLDPEADGIGQNFTPLPVSIPEDIAKGFEYPEQVKKQTRATLKNTVRYGAPDGQQGHRNQTRLKLAAGLALLRSTRTVNTDDWERAGVLMDYSDTVRKWCLNHLEEQSVNDEANKRERRDQADDQVHTNRINRNRRRILEALTDDSSEEPIKWYPLLRARPGRERESMSEALQQLINEQAVRPNYNDQHQTESLTIGAKFTEVCDRGGVTYELRAVS